MSFKILRCWFERKQLRALLIYLMHVLIFIHHHFCMHCMLFILKCFRASKSTKMSGMDSNHRHKIRFQDFLYLKCNKWMAKILNVSCNMYQFLPAAIAGCIYDLVYTNKLYLGSCDQSMHGNCGIPDDFLQYISIIWAHVIVFGLFSFRFTQKFRVLPPSFPDDLFTCCHSLWKIIGRIPVSWT